MAAWARCPGGLHGVETVWLGAVVKSTNSTKKMVPPAILLLLAGAGPTVRRRRTPNSVLSRKLGREGRPNEREAGTA